MDGYEEPGVTCERGWGRAQDGTPVARWVLDDGVVRVGLVEHGARVQSLLAPDARGDLADVVLGFDDLTPYAGPGRSFGATVGRFANRIAGGRFSLDGVEHVVPATDRGNAIHGGPHPFSQRLWTSHPLAGRRGVRFSLFSPDGDNGFPGGLSVHVDHVLDGGVLTTSYLATTDATTVLNLTNHTYWNLAGDGSGTVEEHLVEVDAERFLPLDGTGLPTGELRDVAGTSFDLRSPAVLGAVLAADDPQLELAGGLDHCFVLSEEPAGVRPAARAARVEDPASGRVLEVWTDQPGVQVFSAGSLAGTLVGKAGAAYGPRAGLALETQAFPDAPNRQGFPSTVLRPGEEFRSTTQFRLTTA